jgi:DNA adenine methylase
MKYLGGKQRLGKHLQPTLHHLWYFFLKQKGVDLNGYLEPFCGSLGVFKHMTDLGEHGARTLVANDYHPDLITMWKAVQDNTLEYPDAISEEEYIAAKLMPSPNAYKAFVGFGMSFGGRYFGAYSQKYLGDKKEDFCKEMVNSLTRTAPCIQKKKVKFTNQMYQKIKPSKKFIYCDPPYAITKHPIKYRRDVKYYDVFDNSEFWNIMRKWSENNIVVISETDAPEDFVEVWNKERYRSAAQSTKTRFCKASDVESDTHKVEKLFIHQSHLDEELEEFLKKMLQESI